VKEGNEGGQRRRATKEKKIIRKEGDKGGRRRRATKEDGEGGQRRRG
jgi:hypothetical protein